MILGFKGLTDKLYILTLNFPIVNISRVFGKPQE